MEAWVRLGAFASFCCFSLMSDLRRKSDIAVVRSHPREALRECRFQDVKIPLTLQKLLLDIFGICLGARETGGLSMVPEG